MWNQQDTARFRDFHRNTGGRLIQFLRSNIPPLLGKTIESVALEAKHKEGAEHIIGLLEAMLTEKPESGDAASGTFTNM